MDEKDLELERDVKLDIGSICSDFSLHSKKSQPSSKRTRSSARPIRSISSRARSIKEYEDQGSKFLSIDLKPGEETDLTVNKDVRSLSRFSHRSTGTARVSTVHSSGWQSSLADLDLSSRLMSSGLLRPQSSKAYTSMLQNPPKANPKVKMPFKQSNNKPEVTNIVVSPGRDMSERTVLATSVMNKILKEQKPPNVHRVHGRLLKARLKPLDPVVKTSPTIQQCRGIVAETRTYGASSSRTFQRWKSIVSGGHHYLQPDLDSKDSMSMGESIHRTSEVTSPVPSVDLPCETEPVQDSKKDVSSSLNNFTAGDISEMVERENLASVQSDADSDNEADLDAKSETTGVHEGDSQEGKVATTVKNAGSKRPFSASMAQDPGDSVGMRPKTAGDNVRPKSVRFADENKKLPADSTDVGGKDRTKMSKGKESCRPASEGGYRFDDHDDQGHPGHRDSSRYSEALKPSATAGESHHSSDSGKVGPDGKSKSASGADSKEEPSELTQQHSDDKKLVSGRPKSATVFFETDLGLSIETQRNMAVKKAPLGVKLEMYKNQKKQPKASSSTYTKRHSNNEIQNSDYTESHGNSKEDRINEPAKDSPTNISHLPPSGGKPKGHQLHKKAVKKPFNANGRPASASTYINKDVVERKSRASSAGRAAGATSIQIFAERTNILGKHGLLGKKRPSSAPGCAGGHSENNAAHSRSRPKSSHKAKVKSKPCKKNLRKSTRRDLSTDGTVDADKMWDELPNDDDDDFSDDPFLSKFDQLDKELEFNRAELHSETLKYNLQEVGAANMAARVDNVVETEANRDKMPTRSPVKIPGEDNEAEDDVEDVSEGNIPLKPSEEVSGSDLAELETVTTISALLYKKTNLFIPLSKRGRDKHLHLTRNSSASSKQFTGDETGDLSANRGEEVGNLRSLGEECVTDKVIDDLQETAASLLKGELDTADDDADVNAVEERIEEVRRQLEMDYPHLMKLKQNQVSCTKEESVVNENDVKLSYGERRRASDADSLYQGDLYTSLLQAYRHRFTESSQNNSDDDLDEGIITKSKKAQLHQKAERAGAQRLRRNSQQRSTTSANKADAKTRPWSGTTNDSGLESDVQSNEDEENDVVVERTLGVTHPPTESDIVLPTNNATKMANVKGNQQTVPDYCNQETKLSSALQIVAEAKKLSKPRNKPRHKEDMSTLCRLPPLCFRLNAKPPSGHLFYFAYDQSMSMDRMMAYLGVEKAPLCFWALLFGFELVFNKKADMNSDLKEVGGFPNLSYNASSSVEGCLYQLTPGQLECLDKFMGYPQNCEHIVLPVWMSNCCSPEELGIAQYCVAACTYIAKDEATWAEPVLPNEFALAQCIKAADLLTPAYRDHLSSKSSPQTEVQTSDPAAFSTASVEVCVN